MNEHVVIVGAGGFAREVRQIFAGQLDTPTRSFKGFLGRDHGVERDPALENWLIGDPESYQPQGTDRFILAIGNMDARQRTVDALLNKGGQFLTMVHPTSFVAPSARLGDGVLLYPYSVVSHEAVLSDFVKLNYFSCVGHNARLGRFCLLAPYATVNGYAVLEDQVYMSTHSTVGPQVSVGTRVTISANSAITRDVPADCFVHGVPGVITRRLTLT